MKNALQENNKRAVEMYPVKHINTALKLLSNSKIDPLPYLVFFPFRDGIKEMPIPSSKRGIC